jgi:subtilisin family serine protease
MTKLDFDQLLDVPTLRAALAESRGRNVNVAVLDTGVDVTHPDLQGVVSRSVEVVAEGRSLVCRDVPAELLSAAELDPVGHGTACAGIIHELAPEARIISVRVIGASATGTGEQFVRGLQWVLEQTEPPIRAVNLSLGTLQDRFAIPLRRLVDQAYFQGVVLVAAGNNMGMPSYPAVFASLIAVDNESYTDPTTFEFRVGQTLELAARGIYVRAPKSGGGYQLWTGTSFACPHITGQVARLLSINPALTPFQIKTLLYVLRANRTPKEAQEPAIREGPRPQ